MRDGDKNKYEIGLPDDLGSSYSDVLLYLLIPNTDDRLKGNDTMIYIFSYLFFI